MKNKTFYSLAGIFGLLLAVLLVTAAKSPVIENDLAGANIYTYSVTDTITDTENDTITVPVKLTSQWSGGWFMEITQLTGTGEVSVVANEHGRASGTTGWYVQTTDMDLTGSSDVDRLVYDKIHGQRARAIVDGGQDGSATQSTRYTLTFIGKKTQ